MKSLPKVLFALFVIGIIGFAIYMVYNNQSKNEVETEVRTSETKPQIINELRLGIAEYDTINPLISNNKNVQDIAKIIYEPNGTPFPLVRAMSKPTLPDSSNIVSKSDMSVAQPFKNSSVVAAIVIS